MLNMEFLSQCYAVSMSFGIAATCLTVIFKLIKRRQKFENIQTGEMLYEEK